MARWGFRVSFLENSDKFETAQDIANHESPTTINRATFFLHRRPARRTGEDLANPKNDACIQRRRPMRSPKS
jgi:hypothetical protein